MKGLEVEGSLMDNFQLDLSAAPTRDAGNALQDLSQPDPLTADRQHRRRGARPPGRDPWRCAASSGKIYFDQFNVVDLWNVPAPTGLDKNLDDEVYVLQIYPNARAARAAGTDKGRLQLRAAASHGRNRSNRAR